MTNAQFRNVSTYILIALGGAILATGVHLGAALSGPDEIMWRPLAATFVTTLFAALTTAAGTAFRPRAGREDISALVSEVGPGPAKAALEVAAVQQATGAGTEQPFTPMQVNQLAARLLELRAEHEHDAGEHPIVMLPPEGRG